MVDDSQANPFNTITNIGRRGRRELYHSKDPLAQSLLDLSMTKKQREKMLSMGGRNTELGKHTEVTQYTLGEQSQSPRSPRNATYNIH